MDQKGNKGCDSNRNPQNGFWQSKRKPVDNYGNKFNPKNDTKNQNPPQNQPIREVKMIQPIMDQKGNKGCDSNRNPKNGFTQSKRKPVDKYGNKFNSNNGPKMPTYQMKESNELPISDMLDQESDFVGSALAQSLRNFRRKTLGNPCLSKDQSPPPKQDLSSKDRFMQKICKTEKNPLEDGTGLHFFFKVQKI